MAVNKKRTFKTKRVVSGVKTAYRAWKEWDEGDVIICKLIGTSPNRKAKGKNDWIVEVIETHFADKKEAKRLPAGSTLTLNCAGQLDKGMKQLDLQTIVQITYNGTKEMEGGDYAGQDAHMHEVLEVEEDNGDEDSEDQDDSEDDEDSEDEDSEEDDEDEDL